MIKFKAQIQIVRNGRLLVVPFQAIGATEEEARAAVFAQVAGEKNVEILKTEVINV